MLEGVKGKDSLVNMVRNGNVIMEKREEKNGKYSYFLKNRKTGISFYDSKAASRSTNHF